MYIIIAKFNFQKSDKITPLCNKVSSEHKENILRNNLMKFMTIKYISSPNYPYCNAKKNKNKTLITIMQKKAVLF